jgi:hypothetical protein
MLTRLKFPIAGFLVLLLAALASTRAEAAHAYCNSKFCNEFGICEYQINGPPTWCFSAPGMCMWSGDCRPI